MNRPYFAFQVLHMLSERIFIKFGFAIKFGPYWLECIES